MIASTYCEAKEQTLHQPTLPGKYNETSTVATARLIDSLVTLNLSIV